MACEHDSFTVYHQLQYFGPSIVTSEITCIIYLRFLKMTVYIYIIMYSIVF